MEKAPPSRRPRYPMPEFIREVLLRNGLLERYRERPPYQQNDYIGWINRAKLPETKEKRLAQMLEELKDGNRYMKMPYRAKIKTNETEFDPERFTKQLNFLIELDQVKQVLRNTLLMDASRLENDAEHTWHMAVAAILFQEYSNEKDLDMVKVLKMILLHDVVKIYAGDTFVYALQENLDKAERETVSAQRIFGLLPPDQETEFRSLWEEFEEAATAEAQFTHAVDTFMPIFHNYRTQGLQWQRLNVTREKVLQRNRRLIEPGSDLLWQYIESIVEDAAKKGYLKSESTISGEME